jgi:hypothetical protein
MAINGERPQMTVNPFALGLNIGTTAFNDNKATRPFSSWKIDVNTLSTTQNAPKYFDLDHINNIQKKISFNNASQVQTPANQYQTPANAQPRQSQAPIGGIPNVFGAENINSTPMAWGATPNQIWYHQDEIDAQQAFTDEKIQKSIQGAAQLPQDANMEIEADEWDGVLGSFIANIDQGDDIAVIREKYPELANLDDEWIGQLIANIDQGDDVKTIMSKYPELQGGLQPKPMERNIMKSDNPYEQIFDNLDNDINSLADFFQSKKFKAEDIKKIGNEEGDWKILTEGGKYAANVGLNTATLPIGLLKLVQELTQPGGIMKVWGAMSDWGNDYLRQIAENNEKYGEKYASRQITEDLLSYAYENPVEVTLLGEGAVKWAPKALKTIKAIPKNVEKAVDFTKLLTKNPTIVRPDGSTISFRQAVGDWVKSKTTPPEWYGTPDITKNDIPENTVDWSNQFDTTAGSVRTYWPKEADIDKILVKAVGQNVGGLKDAGKVKRSTNNMKAGLTTIIQMRDDLNLPKTELGDIDYKAMSKNENSAHTIISDNIFEANKQIWNKVTEAQKLAGEEGIVVDTSPLVDLIKKEVNKIVDSQGTVIPWAEGGYAAYQKIINYLADGKKVEDLQKLSQTLNRQAKSLYLGNTATPEAIIAEGVNYHLRELLDKVIDEQLGVQGFGELKRKRGELKSIEAAITKRGQVIDRQKPVGLYDFLWNAGYADAAIDIGMGIFTANPFQAAKGVAQAGIVKFLKDYVKGKNSQSQMLIKAIKLLDEANAGKKFEVNMDTPEFRANQAKRKADRQAQANKQEADKNIRQSQKKAEEATKNNLPLKPEGLVFWGKKGQIWSTAKPKYQVTIEKNLTPLKPRKNIDNSKSTEPANKKLAPLKPKKEPEIDTFQAMTKLDTDPTYKVVGNTRTVRNWDMTVYWPIDSFTRTNQYEPIEFTINGKKYPAKDVKQIWRKKSAREIAEEKKVVDNSWYEAQKALRKIESSTTSKSQGSNLQWVLQSKGYTKVAEVPESEAAEILKLTRARTVKDTSKVQVKESNPLLAEVKKYKSAEDFIKAWQKVDGIMFRWEGKWISKGRAKFGIGQYFSENPWVASEYGDVSYFKLPDDIKLINGRDKRISDFIDKNYNPWSTDNDYARKLTEKVKKLWYDWVEIWGNVVIYDRNIKWEPLKKLREEANGKNSASAPKNIDMRYIQPYIIEKANNAKTAEEFAQTQLPWKIKKVSWWYIYENSALVNDNYYKKFEELQLAGDKQKLYDFVSNHKGYEKVYKTEADLLKDLTNQTIPQWWTLREFFNQVKANSKVPVSKPKKKLAPLKTKKK